MGGLALLAKQRADAASGLPGVAGGSARRKHDQEPERSDRVGGTQRARETEQRRGRKSAGPVRAEKRG